MDAATASIISGLGGVSVTATYSILKDKLQWGRDNRVRYNDRRVTAYADFLTSGKLAAETHDRQTFYDFQHALGLVALLATKQTKEAAELLGQAVAVIVTQNASRKPEERFDLVQQAYLESVTAGFFDAAHQELGADKSLHVRPHRRSLSRPTPP